MPLDRLVLIILIVIAAAGATIWLGAWAAAAYLTPFAWLVAIPFALIAYILIRVISDRVTSSEDDHYDRME
jgi:membrane protein implicated in regulation of membrane protease activity